MDFEKILRYCGGLQANNDRTWFHQNHNEYDTARKEFTAFLDMFRFRLSEQVPEIGKSIMYMEPREWMYRVAKDMRFHKNGPPYNPAFRAYIAADKKSWLPIGYYLRVCPGSSCFGTGVWCASTTKMNDIRKYISLNYAEFSKIIKKGNLVVAGDKLKNVPRGFSAEDPAAEYLKHKNWMVIFDIPDEDIGSFEEFCDLLSDYVRRIEPLRAFLLRAAAYEDNRRPEFEW